MIRTALRAVALALPVLLALPAWAQEEALTRRPTELRDAPGDKGRSVAILPAQAAVTRTNERQGPWVQVRTAGGATGWVHLFDIGPAAAAAPAQDGGGVIGGALRGVTSLFGGSGSSPRRTQAATTAGIRGLDAEDLANAQPDAAAVRHMEGLRASENDARAFASRAPWKPVAIADTPASSRVAPASANGAPRAEQAP